MILTMPVVTVLVLIIIYVVTRVMLSHLTQSDLGLCRYRDMLNWWSLKF